QVAADLVQHVDRPRLVFAQLLDQFDALLEQRLLLFEIVNLRDDGLEAGRFLLRTGDVGRQTSGFVTEQPIPPATDEPTGHENRAANSGQLLLDGECELLLGELALGNEVDANHRSPAFRSARPTATAPVDASCCTSTPSCCASHAIFLKGSNISTGALKRSSRACMKPSTQAAPPLR